MPTLLLFLRGEQILSSGQCGCLDYDLTQGDDYETVYNRLDMIDDVMPDASADTKRQVVAIICGTTVNDGDHLQVCSPLYFVRRFTDILFVH